MAAVEMLLDVAMLRHIAGAALLILALCILNKIFQFIVAVYKTEKAMAQFPNPDRHWLYGTMYSRKIGKMNYEHLLRDLEEVKKNKYYLVRWYGPLHPILLMAHPDAFKSILKIPDAKGKNYDIIRPWLGEGLLIASGAKWARNRHLLTPAFHFDILRPYINIYNETAEVFLEKMKKCADEGCKFNATSNISLLTLDIILKCAFSYETDCQTTAGESNPYIQAVYNLSRQASKIMFVLPFMRPFISFTKLGREFKKNCDIVHKAAEDVIAARNNILADNEDLLKDRKYLDFLDILLTARDTDGQGLTDIEIRSEVDTFLFEGHDTTSSGITWMLYLMAKHPEYQTRVQEELDSIVQENGHDSFEWKDMEKMKYLTMCIKETLRLCPPVPLFARTLGKDVIVMGKTVPKGTFTAISTWLTHHNPHLWDRPMEFNPERFSPENIDNIDPYAYIPFSAGPRNCIGKHFALNEEKVILARILHRFRLETDDDVIPSTYCALTLKSEEDILLKVTERSSFREE